MVPRADIEELENLLDAYFMQAYRLHPSLMFCESANTQHPCMCYAVAMRLGCWGFYT